MKMDFTLERLYELCEDVINFRNKGDNDRLKGWLFKKSRDN